LRISGELPKPRMSSFYHCPKCNSKLTLHTLKYSQYGYLEYFECVCGYEYAREKDDTPWWDTGD